MVIRKVKFVWYILPMIHLTSKNYRRSFSSHEAPWPKNHQFLSSLALFYSIFTWGARFYGLYCSRLSHFREFQVSKSHFLVLKFLNCWPVLPEIFFRISGFWLQNFGNFGHFWPNFGRFRAHFSQIWPIFALPWYFYCIFMWQFFQKSKNCQKNFF